jgi:hypothetical protein
MSNVSPIPDRVRLDDLTDLAGAVPHLLGFHPSESVVAIALSGPRERLVFSMRLDLLDPRHDGDVARMTAARMTQAQADAVLLFVYTDGPLPGRDLPRRDLVVTVAAALDVPLRESLLVDDGRVWSYLCSDETCCPAQGRAIRPDSPGALALAAAYALNGNAVLPDRDALVATTRPVAGVRALSMSQAIVRASAGPAGGHEAPDFVATSVALLDQFCARLAEPRAELAHDEAATLVVRLHHIGFRDLVISRLAGGDDTTDRLVARVAHLAQPPYDAPVASVLAMAAYFRGDGVVAMAAAERALETDPSYSLAQLVCDCIGRQVRPADVRDVWRRAA